MGDFSLPDFNWEHLTAGTNRFRIFLKLLDDDFMAQILREPTGQDALLDLSLAHREDLTSERVIGGCLGHSDNETIEF